MIIHFFSDTNDWIALIDYITSLNLEIKPRFGLFEPDHIAFERQLIAYQKSNPIERITIEQPLIVFETATFMTGTIHTESTNPTIKSTFSQIKHMIHDTWYRPCDYRDLFIGPSLFGQYEIGQIEFPFFVNSYTFYTNSEYIYAILNKALILGMSILDNSNPMATVVSLKEKLPSSIALTFRGFNLKYAKRRIGAYLYPRSECIFLRRKKNEQWAVQLSNENCANEVLFSIYSKFRDDSLLQESICRK